MDECRSDRLSNQTEFVSSQACTPLGSRGGNRPSGNELLGEHVDPQIHSFEGARTQQEHVSDVGEDENVGRRAATRVDVTEADRSLDLSPVRGDEANGSYRDEPE